MAGEQTVAELILKIVADSSEVRKELQSAVDAEKKFAKQSKESSSDAANAIDDALDKTKEKGEKTKRTLDNFGGNLRTISRNMTLLGTAITATFLAPMVSASKVNSQVAWSFRQLQNASQGLSVEIGKAGAPLIEKFAKSIESLTKWVKEMPQGQKDAIVQIGLWTGAILTSVGVITKLISALQKLGALGKIPIVARVLGIAAPVAIAAGIGIGAAKAWETWGDKVLKSIDVFVEKGKFKLRELWEWANRPIGEAAPKVMKFGWEGIEPGQSKIDLGQLVVIKNKPADKAAVSSFWEEIKSGFKLGLDDLVKDLGNWGAVATNMTKTIATAMSTMFSNFFFDLFTGDLKSAEEYIAEFGKSILQMFANLIAQILVYSAVVAGMRALGIPIPSWLAHSGGAVKHVGGYIRKAHEGLSPGEVPIVAQTGEGILSRNGMATLGSVDNLNRLNAGQGVGGGVTIYLNQAVSAWDAQDVYRNRKVLAAGMIEELERNSNFRGAMRKYR